VYALSAHQLLRYRPWT